MMNNIINILAKNIILRIIYILRYVICYIFHSSFRIYNEQKTI